MTDIGLRVKNLRSSQGEIHWTSAQPEAELADCAMVPIHRYIEAHAAEQPEAIAVTFADQPLSYNELNWRANQLAHWLIEAGVGAEVPVAVCLKASPEIAVTLLAILKAGGVYLPLDPTDPLERIATMLKDSDPRVILTQSYLLQNLPALGDTQLFCVERDWGSIQSCSKANPDSEIDSEQTAYLVYTSGTTGKPKGVMASHRNLVHYILSAHDRYNFNTQDIMPALARFTFSISLFELLSPLVAGGRLLLLERDHILNFKHMAAVLDRITVIHASPSWWRRLLAYMAANHLDNDGFAQLRHASSGGDSVPGDLLETMKGVFPNAEIFVIYGCTEISCMGCTYPALRSHTITEAWLGKPFGRVTVRLFDPDQRAVSDGVEGEVYIAGPGVTKGYLNLSTLTQEKFVAVDGQRFYRTGDLGRFENGDLQMLGRVDFQIQLRGIRIEPSEIEIQLRLAPGVRDAVVVARELGASEKSLIAYVVLEQKEQEIESIRRFLKPKLPDYMLPAAFVILDAIPVNSNQKVDRQALPAPTSENLAKLKTVVPPRDAWETQLIEIWENTLGVHPIGIRNTFFELGGDSLQGVYILMQIEERWNQNLPISILVEANSIEALAAVIRDREDNHAPGKGNFSNNVVPLRSGGERPPLFCLQGVILYHALAQHVDADQPVYAVFLPEEVELIKTRMYDPVNSVLATIPQMAASYLRAIRSVQPEGPYYLAGSSFAGLIAFEMAHELQAAGEEVALVAMFDSMMIRKIPLSRRLRCHWQLLREQGVSYLRKKVRHRMEEIYRILTLPAEKRHGQVRSAPADSSGVTIEAQQDILDEVSVRAARSYTPRPYSGKLVLFRATDQTFFSEDVPDLGWAPFAAGAFEVYDVPGNHMGILRAPSVSLLVRLLQSHLGENPKDVVVRRK